MSRTNRFGASLRASVPEQLKLALWTRKALTLPVERECRVKLPVRSVGEYWKRWGSTP